jgi:hypothetical protein
VSGGETSDARLRAAFAEAGRHGLLLTTEPAEGVLEETGLAALERVEAQSIRGRDGLVTV